MSERYLLNPKTGVKFLWTEELAKRNDLREISDEPAVRINKPAAKKADKAEKPTPVFLVTDAPVEPSAFIGGGE